jgi:hypothetical protein
VNDGILDVGDDTLVHAALRKAIQLVAFGAPHRNPLLLRQTHHLVEPIVGAQRHPQRRHAFRAQGFDDGVDAVDPHR